jgi:hypothetical protein
MARASAAENPVFTAVLPRRARCRHHRHRRGRLPASGGERRVVRVTASLTAGHPVSPRDAIPGLDPRNLELVTTANPPRRRPVPVTLTQDDAMELGQLLQFLDDLLATDLWRG